MKEDTTPIDPTWMAKTGGYARDMTLRDYFAAEAMQSIISDPAMSDSAEPNFVSKWAFLHADAMLKAREGK